MPYQKRILVFGATGEIGGRIARGCVDAGHRVTGVTRGVNPRPRVPLDGVELLVGDKGDPATFTNLLGGREFNAIIDSVPRTEHVQLVFDHFVGRIEHYCMCSSTGCFVPLQYLPAGEDHPWREKTEVNFHRQCERDAFALSLHHQHRFPVVILRPTNIIGAHRVPLETWGGRSPLYFKLLREHQTVEIPLTGQTLLQPGCNDDIAAAFVHAVDKGPEIEGGIFNISCPYAITLDRYVDTAKEILGSRSPVEYVLIDELLKRHPDEATYKGARFLAEHMCFDLSKAERLLDYHPQYTAEQGLERALEWCLDKGII